MKRVIAALGTSAALLTLAGCAAPDATAPTPPSFVGSNLGQAEKAIPPDTAFVVYDVSFPVAGREATYTSATAGAGTGWIVVIHCEDQAGVAVGVIRAEDYTPERVEEARAGKYDALLAECQEANQR